MERNPAVKKFMDEALAETEQTDYAFTVLGRRRFLPEIVSYSKHERARAARQAGNLPIQGSAADCAKMAMILIDEADLESRFGCKMLLQVHDELIFECPEETTDEAMDEIRMWMEHPLPTDLAVAVAAGARRSPRLFATSTRTTTFLRRLGGISAASSSAYSWAHRLCIW